MTGRTHRPILDTALDVGLKTPSHVPHPPRWPGREADGEATCELKFMLWLGVRRSARRAPGGPRRRPLHRRQRACQLLPAHDRPTVDAANPSGRSGLRTLFGSENGQWRA
jgi:hypothetical protein